MYLKIGLLSFALLFSSLHAHTQDYIVPDASCGLPDTLFQFPPLLAFASDKEARDVMERIVEVMGLRANFVVQAARVPNAAAAIIGTQRYVLYNPNFISEIRMNSRHDWSAISVLAHEIGHHLNGHTLQISGSRPAMELEADEFSGFVLRKMGASLSEAQSALQLLANPYGSLTHPPARDRLVAVETGWNRADNYLKDNFLPVATYAPDDALYQVSFDKNPGRIYFLTRDYSFIAVKEGNRVKMGAMQPNSSASYPFVIRFQGNEDNGIYMARNGKLVTPSGKTVGWASALQK